ncbi:MAG TPA: GNAT family N-acetyltransferase, partial [Caldilineaceae bacterium]|nr:GNAT family N-acetyltransferase [Caldilineaceae bacterium]
LFIDVLTAARLEAAQAWRATYFAQSHLERHPDPQGAILNVGNAQVVYGGADLPVNRAIGLGMVDPVRPAHLEAIEEFYAVRGLPARVDLCPLADNSLIMLLGERGYRVERFYTVLVTRLPSPEASEPPGDIRITPATPGDAARWVQVVSQGFDEAEQSNPETVRILSANFHAQNAYAFFAWIGDEPAGGGGMYLYGGVAEFGGASTRVAYRRQGVQTALLRHRLAAAHLLGCDYAMVLTAPGAVSQRNVQRLGFQVAYTKATMVRGIG